MRFSIGLPRPDQGEALVAAETLVEVACAIEAAGLDACAVSDHPFPLVDGTGTAHHTLDPFALLAYVAACTTSLRLHTNLIVLPYRNPFLTANAVSTLDNLSGGRTVLGVGAGYSKAEFAALGADFARRNETVDEALAAMKRAWTGEPLTGRGAGWVAGGNSLPPPSSSPHPPIWIGGNSDRAITRAAAAAQGWSPFLVDAARARDTGTQAIDSPSALSGRIASLLEQAERHGRDEPLDVCVVRPPVAWPPADGRDDAMLDELGRLAEGGVTWLSFRFAARDKPELLEAIAAWGELAGAPDRRR